MYTFHNTHDSIICLDFSGDQKLVAAAWHLDADVGEHQVVPLEHRHQPISGREVDAGLPLLGADLVLAAGDFEGEWVHRVSPVVGVRP